MAARNPAPEPAPERRFGRRPKKQKDGPSTFEQFKLTAGVVRRNDARAIPLAIGVGVLALAILVGVGFATGHVIVFPIAGVLLAPLVGLNVFGFRARKAVYAEVADQKGVALEVIRKMRGDWKITEVVQFNRQQDCVHRVVGRPGIVLVAEGRPQAARDLLVNELRRVKRIASDTPTYEIMIGDRPGDVPIAKLSNHLAKLPRKLSKDQVRSLDVKLKAVANTNVGVPKGPMPTHVKRPKVR